MILNNKSKMLTVVLFVLGCFATQITLASRTAVNTVSSTNPYADSFLNLSRLHPVLELGGFSASQGQAQDIDIDGLIGDRFTVTKNHDQNVLVGLGVFVDGFTTCRTSTMFGINAFYLAKTFVKGDIIQEQEFTNLDYRYAVTNYPIYVAAKTLINTNSDKYNITFDLGVGPNIIKTGRVNESSLDDGVTLPDNAFSGKTHVALSATAGIGVKFNNVLGCAPVEIGYRFFYLGKGEFKKETDELLTTLNTGNSYANALVVTISV